MSTKRKRRRGRAVVVKEPEKPLWSAEPKWLHQLTNWVHWEMTFPGRGKHFDRRHMLGMFLKANPDVLGGKSPGGWTRKAIGELNAYNAINVRWARWEQQRDEFRRAVFKVAQAARGDEAKST